MPDSRTYVLVLPPGTPILTGNNRMNRWDRNRRNRELRDIAIKMVRVQRIPPLGLTDVLVEYESPPRLKRLRHPFASAAVTDTDALDPTKKALVDGLVEAGVWPSDQRGRVRRSACELATAHHPRGLVRITLTEVSSP